METISGLLRAGSWMKYEFKKLCHSKIIWIGLIFILAAIVYTSVFAGLTRKKIINNEDEYASQVIDLREKIVNNARYLLDISSKNSDKVINRLNIKYYQRNLNLKKNDNIVLGWMLGAYDNMYYADGIIMIILAVMIVYLFISEHANETFILNFSSKRGRWKLYANKLAVIGICITSAVILEIVIINIIAVINGNGIPFNETIQQSWYAMRSPYSLNYFQYLLCVAGMKIFGYLTFVSLIVFITSIFTRIWVPLFIGVSYSVGRIVTYVYITEKVMEGRHLCKVMCIIQKVMQDYSTISFNFGPGLYLKQFKWNIIGDIPVFSWIMVIISGVAVIVLFTVYGGAVYSRRSNRC